MRDLSRWIHHLWFFADQHCGFKSERCNVGRNCTHRFRMRDSAGFSAPSTSVPSTSVCPNRELLSSSSLPRKNKHFTSDHISTQAHYFWIWWMCVSKTDLLLHSFTGIPSIFALMSFLLLLMAERTASNRKPGHLSSFRISLQIHTIIYMLSGTVL